MNGKNDLFKLNGISGPHLPTLWKSPLIYRGDNFEPFPYEVWYGVLLVSYAQIYRITLNLTLSE